MLLTDTIKNALRWQPGLISRATVLILAACLFRMAFSHRLPPPLGTSSLVFGGLGLAWYIALELAATYWLRCNQAAFLKRTRKVIDGRLQNMQGRR